MLVYIEQKITEETGCAFMTEKNTEKKKILILDDKKETTDFIELLLEMEQFEVRSLNNPIELVPILKKEQFDLLLLDIMMPGLDGWQVTRLIKSEKEHKKMPIIILSCLTDKKSKFIAKKFGVDDFVEKPFSPEVLVSKIKKLLGM
ncbi:MAG: hypothetical protein C0601_13010 [Candidatus Muiribacterium halophilum]|uniref:Response regulatory domain-containing protein n=1 Tax=Muiribacterium halophilum TaxID=2053465 RepID=A0A2N5Z9L6_MUIH1|nr:MAG: hypothetical protein C0601_13010 [Candidatus Muirbacterium halophilum]